MTSPTVVTLNNDARRPVRLPPIVHTLRQHTRRQLAELCRDLFNSTDDALFELADRSESNTEQTLFFESMRQIRLRRDDVIAETLKGYHRSFELLFARGPLDAEANTLPASQQSVEDLSLLGNDELEINVAMNGMVSKVASQHSALLAELTKRIDYICKAQTITEQTNPLGPTSLCQSFIDAVAMLGLDIRVSIILLKLYERLVMERLGPIYQAANKLLIEAGILPEQNLQARPSAPAAAQKPQAPVQQPVAPGSNPAASAAPPPADPAMHSIIDTRPLGAATLPGAEFGVIQRLLANAQAPQPGMLPGYGGAQQGFNPYTVLGGPGYGAPVAGATGSPMAGGNASFSGMGGGAATASSGSYAGSAGTDAQNSLLISTPQLVGLLNELQQDHGEQSIDLDSPPPLLDLRNIVFQRADQGAGEPLDADTQPTIDRNDDDALNIVAMLFDFILNDRNLAIPMKALISRLQIPFVKLAVMDKSFFERSGHPARQLLNELASAGIGWSSAAELKRDALYDKIESTVVSVINNFTEDPGIFDVLVEDLRAFVRQDKQRNSQVEKRVQDVETGKARTQAIKLTVQQIINQKASGLRLPSQIGQFVSDTFARGMVMTGIKHGDASGDWQMNLKTLDDLLWACQPLDTVEDIDRRDALLDDLLTRLRGMIAQTVDDEAQINTLIDDIRAELAQAITHDKAYLDDDEPVLPDPAEQYEAVEEITLAEVTFLEQPEIQVAPSFVAQINDLVEGGWVELKRSNANALRCKLTTIIQPGDRYVFVNRRGMKIAEYTRMELAKQLEEGRLALLDESEVFDRALQAVVGNLRELQKDRRPGEDQPPAVH
ncbi:MAG: DUF1631 domain-containing protein [Pseudomonadota bacterium]